MVDLRPEVAEEIRTRAEEIARIAAMYDLASDGETFATSAMIGGALWLMAPLEEALRAQGVTPLYAFSCRESVEEPQADGSVRKINVFRHVGFVESA